MQFESQEKAVNLHETKQVDFDSCHESFLQPETYIHVIFFHHTH